MPSTHAYHDERFLMLPVSPARSTDSQIDASTSSKLNDEEIFITEAQTGSLMMPTESSSVLLPVFRPTAWSDSPLLFLSKVVSSSQEKASTTQEATLASDFWTIQRSYAFDEDDNDDAISTLDEGL